MKSIARFSGCFTGFLFIAACAEHMEPSGISSGHGGDASARADAAADNSVGGGRPGTDAAADNSVGGGRPGTDAAGGGGGSGGMGAAADGSATEGSDTSTDASSPWDAREAAITPLDASLDESAENDGDAEAAPFDDADAEAAPFVDADAAPACTRAAPDACAMPMPSYATDIVPILDAKCNNCHMAGAGRPWPLTTYTDVWDWQNLIGVQIEACAMPPADGGTPPLTPSEQDTVLAWIACGAPDN